MVFKLSSTIMLITFFGSPFAGRRANLLEFPVKWDIRFAQKVSAVTGISTSLKNYSDCDPLLLEKRQPLAGGSVIAGEKFI
jgi:hypothetical protein